ncbi:MAG: hypothetical protein ACTS4T_01545, partial [Candidatus Hodgkinia cicadicola]
PREGLRFSLLRGFITLIALRCERICPSGVELLGERSVGFRFCSKEMTCAVAFRLTCCALPFKANTCAEVRRTKFIKFALTNCVQRQVNENRLLKLSLSPSAVRSLEALIQLKTFKLPPPEDFTLRWSGRGKRNLPPLSELSS